MSTAVDNDDTQKPLAVRLQEIRERHGITDDDTGDPPDSGPTLTQMRANRLLEGLERQLPTEYKDARLSRLEGLPGELTRDWAENTRGRNCIHIGNVGAGKSYAGAASARYLAGRHAIHARWTTLAQVMTGLKPGGTVDRDSLNRAGVLVLDEVGAKQMTQWEHDVFAEIIDARVSAHLPTVITTNLDIKKDRPDEPDGLKEVLDPMVYSRLVFSREGGQAVVIRWNGRDRRRTPTT